MRAIVAAVVLAACARPAPAGPRTLEMVVDGKGPRPHSELPPDVDPTLPDAGASPADDRPSDDGRGRDWIVFYDDAGRPMGTGKWPQGGMEGPPLVIPPPPPVPKVRVREGTLTVNGRLPADVVRRVLAQRMNAHRRCYAATAAPSLVGNLQVRFVIDREGHVTQLSDLGSTLPAAILACSMKVIERTSFPMPEGGVVAVTYGITLGP